MAPLSCPVREAKVQRAVDFHVVAHKTANGFFEVNGSDFQTMQENCPDLGRGRMSLAQIDEMVDFAVEQITKSPDGFRHVTRELVEQYPDVQGLQFVFVLVSAAHAIERVFTPETGGTDPQIDRIFRLAGLLGCDLFALQAKGQVEPDGLDLLAYWRKEDPFFLLI